MKPRDLIFEPSAVQVDLLQAARLARPFSEQFSAPCFQLSQLSFEPVDGVCVRPKHSALLSSYGDLNIIENDYQVQSLAF